VPEGIDQVMVPLPERGRVFRARRKVRLGDVAPSGRLRLDACARYLQDVGNDDTADSGLDDVAGLGAGVWVVRRAVLDLISPPRWGEWVDLATWCGGTGGRWAERRLSVRGDGGGHVEVTTLWIHLGRETLMPTRLPAAFTEIYGEAAGDRRVSARLWLDPPPPGGGDADGDVESRPWPLRAVDFDVMRHVNNAAYWAAVEEVLAAGRDQAPRLGRGRTVRAVLEFGAGIGPEAKVDLRVRRRDGALDIWFTEDGDGTVHAAARLFEPAVP
jgi:acyl-ACP thioesterase